MSVISQIKWKLASTEKKLATLKKRGLTIGEGCEILNGYDFGSEPYLVTIGENVRITAGVKITTHDGGCWVLRHMHPELSDCDRFGRVTIGDNCHIGMNALILPGVTIGRDCIVGPARLYLTTSPMARLSPAYQLDPSVRLKSTATSTMATFS